MKLEWKKEELIHNMGRFWWACGICRQGCADRESITHSKSCPFSDETVKGFHLTVRKFEGQKLTEYAAEQDNAATVESILAANESRKALVCTCGRTDKPCQRGIK